MTDRSSHHSRLLVSVRDADEAQVAVDAGADLVDAKDPSRGALGALPASLVHDIVARVGASAVTSAVAGEPDTPEGLVADVAAMAATAVGYVKVALPCLRDETTLRRAAAEAPRRLIAVAFAEDGVDPDLVPRLAAAGFRGAMIDTRGKDGRRLTDCLAVDTLAGFLAVCRTHGLMSGLAGSLRVADIDALAPLEPDYLGFRGGLCHGGDRTRALDPHRLQTAVETLRASRRCRAA